MGTVTLYRGVTFNRRRAVKETCGPALGHQRRVGDDLHATHWAGIFASKHGMRRWDEKQTSLVFTTDTDQLAA